MFKVLRPHLDQVCSIINCIKISSFSLGTLKFLKASLHSDVSSSCMYDISASLAV